MKISGIYSILHNASGKIYIGSSINIKQRWNAHRSALNRGKHSNPHLQNAWSKYGKDAFTFSILEEVTTDNLEIKENEYISKFGIGLSGTDIFLEEKGFNTHWAGRTGCVDPVKTKRGTDHYLYGKVSHNKGRIYSDEIRHNMSVGQMGKKQLKRKELSAETRKAQADAKRNVPWSQARRDAQNNRSKV